MKKYLLPFLLLLYGIVYLGGCGGGAGEVEEQLGPRIFVINGLGETLSMYDLETGTITMDVVQVGLWPNFLLIRDNLGYMVNSGDNNVQIIDLPSLSQVGVIFIGEGNGPMQVAFGDEKAYVSNLQTNTVSVINVAGQEVIGTVEVGPGPTPIVSASGKIYVGNVNYYWASLRPYGQGTVSVIDPTTDTVINTIEVGINPQAMAIDAGGRIHVICTGNYAEIGGEVWIIDSTTDEIVGEPITLGGAPGSISIAPDGIAYLVSTSWTDPELRGIMSYNTETGEVINSVENLIHIGTNPMGVITDQEGMVYVTDFSEDKVYRYDPATEEIVDLGVVGSGPQAMALWLPG